MSDSYANRVRERDEAEARATRYRDELLEVLREAAASHPDYCVCSVCERAHRHGVIRRQALDRRAAKQLRLA